MKLFCLVKFLRWPSHDQNGWIDRRLQERCSIDIYNDDANRRLNDDRFVALKRELR